MAAFEQHVSFHALDLGIWMKDRPAIVREALTRVISMVDKNRWHTALPLHKYGIDKVEFGLRKLQEGRTMGKIIVEVHNDREVLVCTSKRENSCQLISTTVTAQE